QAVLLLDPAGYSDRPLGGRRHQEHAELSDLHPRLDGDRQYRDVGKLQREMTRPSRVDEARGRVDEQPETPERAFAFQARDDRVAERDLLEGAAEDELARVKDERL